MSIKVTQHRRESAFGRWVERFTLWTRGNPDCVEDDVMLLIVSETEEGTGVTWEIWARNQAGPGSWELVSRIVGAWPFRSAAEEQARLWLAEHGYEVQ